MLRGKRPSVTPAGVIAVIALVLALCGGAIAAKRVLITSTSQISPSVLKKLKGKRGPAGPAGAKGEPGAKGDTGLKGEQGPPGSPWTAGGTLPAGETLTGTWSNNLMLIEEPETTVTTQFAPISFQLPLSAELPQANVSIFKFEEEPGTGDCPGTAAEPEAAPGHLCIYTSHEEFGPESAASVSFSIDPPGTTGVVLQIGQKGLAILRGTWAVTAATP